jgi:hypothetical protein
MRALVATAVAAVAVGSLVTPAHAISSCLNNPDILVLAAAGESSSCVLGPSVPPLVYLVVVAGGSVNITVACSAGFSSYQPNAAAVATGVIVPFSGECTLTIEAAESGTTAVGTIV